MKHAYTTKELAIQLDVTRQALDKRAKREGWPSRPRQGRGGGYEWPFESLPEDVRLRVLRAEQRERDAVCAAGPRPTLATTGVSGTKKRKALAKVDLVALYTEWMDKAGHGSKGAARAEFMNAYKGGAWPALLEVLGSKVSWQSIERWKVSLRRTKTVASLVDTRGTMNAVRTAMDERHAEVLLKLVLMPNSPSIESALSRAGDAMRAMGMGVPSKSTMRRFLKKWKELNFGTWVYTREGKKAWNDKAAFFIERDYSKISVGDIMVADGHVLNFETLNPETGKAQRMELVVWYDMASNCPLGWEIMPTENTQCIASAFRRAVMSLGKYPLIAYLDNGKAFRSKYFNGVDFRQTGMGGLFHDLGIHTIFAWPYHGQSKTVERFFGTLHELEQWTPSYVGNNIDSKPPRLNRGEMMHRKAWDAAGGRALTMQETHVAVARWIDRYINKPQRGHLNGKCPAEVFLAGRGTGVDERELRELMMAKEVRKLGREGVRLFGERYYAPELYSRTHAVQVRYDINDLSSVLVYSRDGERLICEAPRMDKVHPAASLLGSEADKKHFQQSIQLKKEQEQDASMIVRGVLADAMSDQQRRMDELEARSKTGQPEPRREKPLPRSRILSIEKARSKARKKRESAPAYTPPEQVASITSELEKYEYLFTLRYRDGIALREADREWMEYYESTEEYREIAAPRFERRKALYAKASN